MADNPTRGRVRMMLKVPDPDRPLKRNDKGEIVDPGNSRIYRHGDIVELTAEQAEDPVFQNALMSPRENEAYESQNRVKKLEDNGEDEKPRTDETGLTGENVDSTGQGGKTTPGIGAAGNVSATGSSGSSVANETVSKAGDGKAGNETKGATDSKATAAPTNDGAQKTKADGSPF